MIEFKDSGTHDIDYTIDNDVYVDYQTPDMYTTVNLLPGGRLHYPFTFEGYENSRINILGGSTNYLGIYDSSQIDISSGRIIGEWWQEESGEIVWHEGLLESYDSSQVNIHGGLLELLYSYDSSQVNISGGEIDYTLESCGSSLVNVSGGDIDTLISYDSSRVNISGGEIDYTLESYGSSLVNVSGGLIVRELRL